MSATSESRLQLRNLNCTTLVDGTIHLFHEKTVLLVRLSVRTQYLSVIACSNARPMISLRLPC